jgi:fused signal recognition particle receptor
VSFDQAIQLSGIVLSKYDGTSKGGIIFSLKHKLQLPVRMIGVGEGIDDLEDFNVNEFIQAFFANSDTKEDHE